MRKGTHEAIPFARFTCLSGSEALDGQRGFCFGVDETWTPPPADSWQQARVRVAAKALARFCTFDNPYLLLSG
eukprot:5480752-Pleurochrysis_carterae.AAC.2